MNTGGFSKCRARRRRKQCNINFCRVIEVTIPKDTFVVDMGSGAQGSYVRWMRENGWVDVHGIDASPNSIELSGGLVKAGDLTGSAICLELFGRLPEWIICNEVGEHIPDRFSNNLFNNFIGATGILLSWGIPGQRGYHHVNCRTPEWVSCEMGHIGFCLNEEKTKITREIMGRNNQKLMVFYLKGI